MAETGKAAVFLGPGKGYEIQEFEVPTPEPGGVVIKSDRPVVDLFVWDPRNETRFLDNFVTLPSGGEAFLRTEGEPGVLEGRSLAGKHPIER